MRKALVFVASATLAVTGCSTVLVSHVQSNDFETPGVRYWLPAPYLLVKAPVEVSRTETLYSMSPIDKTSLRMVVPCDDGQTACKHPERVPGLPVAPAGGAQSARPGPGGATAAEDGATAHEGGEVGDRRAAVGDSDSAKEDGAVGTSIVWLPDYCQQYAMVEKNHAGSQKVQIQLAEGWKLTALNTEINNTEVLQKMFDTLSSVAGTAANPTQRVAAAAVQPLATAVAQGAQGGRTRLFRRTKITAFKPGLYQLLHYPLTADNQTDCTKLPSFRPPRDATQQSESWSELVSYHEGALITIAAPVEPGRPANVVKPAPH